jgi:hypothetical protein
MKPPAILRFFAYSHLPERLQKVSALFADLAHTLHRSLPDNAERDVALRKLLESKDSAVRSAIWMDWES